VIGEERIPQIRGDPPELGEEPTKTGAAERERPFLEGLGDGVGGGCLRVGGTCV